MGVLFDGDNHIEVAGYSVPSAATGIVSFSFWMRADVISNNNSMFGSATNMEMNMNGGGNLRVNIFGGGAASTFALTAGVWVHIVADGNANTDISRLWVNGVLETTNGGQTSATVGTNLYIGWSNGQPDNRHFVGAIDDFRKYNRLLSLNEIQTIFNTRGKDGITFGLQHRYLFSENAPGTTVGVGGAVDFGSSRNNGNGLDAPLPERIESILSFRKPYL
ncbi:MAG: LamG domain-containing protein [Candidatus Paceibacterota bacterium]